MNGPEEISSPSAGASTPAPIPVTNLFSHTFRAFRYRDFRIMWLGALTSTIGTWMQQVAEAWVVFSLTGSAFYLGLTAFLGQLPIILFTLVGGAAADRIDRRKLLLVSQYIQMGTALTLAILIYFDWIQIWHFLVLVFVVGTAHAFGGPAYQALLPLLVKKEDLPNAIALNSIQFNLSRVFGPLLATAVIALLGQVWCFALNGISFLAVIASLFMIRVQFTPQRTNTTVMGDVREGLLFVKQDRALWQLNLMGFITTFCGISVVTLLPVYAEELLGTGSTGYSAMMAISGVGSLTGALLFASLKALKSRGRFTLYTQMVFALAIIVFAVSRNLLVSYLALFLGGVCLLTLIASINSMVQLAITEKIRGRIMSIFMLAFRGGMPLGSLAAGALAAHLSPPGVLILMGAVLGSSSLAFLASKSPVKDL